MVLKFRSSYLNVPQVLTNFGIGPLVVAAMADDALARSTILPSVAADTDYDAVYAAVMATLRGRWFLEEYARRSRNADTRLILGAIERIEGVIRHGQTREADQGVRIDLLEMARTIAQTRADIAEMRPAPDDQTEAETQPKTESATDILAAAERLQDVAWTMRERGVDMATCDHIANVAAAILAAPLLHEGSGQRTQRLGEVLKYLEQRIDGMLDVSQLVAADEPPAAPTADLTGDLALDSAEPEPARAGAEAPADPLADVAAAMAVLMQPRDATAGLWPDPKPMPTEPPYPAVARPLAAAASEPDQDDEPAAAPRDFRLEPMMPALAATPAEANPTASAALAACEPHDPLAALKAMSEAERIALFT